MLTNHWQEIEVTVVEIKPGVFMELLNKFHQWVILDTGEDLIKVLMEAIDETFNLDGYKEGQKAKWRLRTHKVWGIMGYPLESEQEQKSEPRPTRGKDVHRAAQRKEQENA